MTRAEHLAWVKERALEYLPDRPDLAMSSLISDLNKHDGTRDLVPVAVGMTRRWLDTPDVGQLRATIEALL